MLQSSRHVARVDGREISFQRECDVDSDYGEEMAPPHPKEMAFVSLVPCVFNGILQVLSLALRSIFHPGAY